MAIALGGSSGPAASMNVTPLIDVLLVLLIIFMIITPLTPTGETAAIPQPPPPHTKPQVNDRTIVIQVQEGNTPTPQLKINQDSVTWQDLQARLIDIFKTRAEKVLFVKADDQIPWSSVAQVIDIVHASGVNRVGLLTPKVEQGS